jgi:hypothetical protein
MACLPLRLGSTLLEVIMASAMLAVLLATMLQMLRATNNHQRSNERRVIALQAVQAVADQVANIPWEQLTAESAKQVTIPRPLQSYLPGSTLAITVDEEPAPAAAKRIHVELAWNSADGKPGAPVRLTSWAFPKSPDE